MRVDCRQTGLRARTRPLLRSLRAPSVFLDGRGDHGTRSPRLARSLIRGGLESNDLRRRTGCHGRVSYTIGGSDPHLRILRPRISDVLAGRGGGHCRPMGRPALGIGSVSGKARNGKS